MGNSQIRIAIVDDHELIREGLSDIITHSSPHKVVLTAAHGAELMDKLSALNYVPDVCLLDISMPVMNGYDTMLALNNQYSCMKCLVVTIVETEFSVISMIRKGARGYLSKNSRPADLINAIESVYEYGYYYSKIASENVFTVLKKAKLIGHLSEKELQFLQLCGSDLNFHQIADTMCVSARTIEDYQKRLCLKLHVKNRIGLVLFMVSSGLLPFRHLP
jgi:two-component system invasion response regulator UvrY